MAIRSWRPSLRSKGERQRDRVVTDPEFALYIELCEQPWTDIALFIRYEGMRPGEVYSLRWENVLLGPEGGLILIAAGKSKAARRRLPIAPQVGFEGAAPSAGKAGIGMGVPCPIG